MGKAVAYHIYRKGTTHILVYVDKYGRIIDNTASNNIVLEMLFTHLSEYQYMGMYPV